MPKPNGYVLYEGPSTLDGAFIICVATGFTRRSRNPKTGDMIQTWILRGDVQPHQAVKTGEDVSICGDCPHRGENGKGRSCYVTVEQGPLNVYRAYKAGRYPKLEDASVFAGRAVRLGAYGDPAAVPIEVWRNIMAHAPYGTGYTHQWLHADPELAQWCMASCDDAAARFVAKAMGYRTFRVRSGHDPVLDREVICPASEEAGHKTSCEDCRACGGLSAKARADIVIQVHGIDAKVRAFERRG